MYVKKSNENIAYKSPKKIQKIFLVQRKLNWKNVHDLEMLDISDKFEFTFINLYNVIIMWPRFSWGIQVSHVYNKLISLMMELLVTFKIGIKIINYNVKCVFYMFIAYVQGHL